jgi:hypothetical protein
MSLSSTSQPQQSHLSVVSAPLVSLSLLPSDLLNNLLKKLISLLRRCYTGQEKPLVPPRAPNYLLCGLLIHSNYGTKTKKCLPSRKALETFISMHIFRHLCLSSNPKKGLPYPNGELFFVLKYILCKLFTYKIKIIYSFGSRKVIMAFNIFTTGNTTM